MSECDDDLDDREVAREARRVLRNPRSTPDQVRAARYLLCVLERERARAPHRPEPAPLPPLPPLTPRDKAE